MPLYKNETITKGRLNVFLGWESFNPKGNVAPGRMDQNMCGRLWTANDRAAVTLAHASLPEPLTCATRAKLDALAFKPATIGDEFGPTFASHIFRLDIVVPDAMDGKQVHLLWDSNTEGMVLDEDGRPRQGLVGGDHWARRADHPLFIPARPDGVAKAGETLRLYVEISCNGLFGAGRGGDIEPPELDRKYKLEECCLAVFDPEAWGLIHDATLLSELVKHLPADSTRRVEALHTANAVVNAVEVDDPATYARGREVAKRFLGATNGAGQARVSVMLHSHIDLAWLWPMAATPAKGARTFATKLRLMDMYPEVLFVQSQAQLYEWVKDGYPALWTEIKQRVKEGRFVPVGATWVEMDCNIPNGESLLRQFVVGQAFFKENFDMLCEEFWLPDTFGYAAQLPQIMQGCGVKNFMTQKLSWNLFNKFPHTTFMWEGLDGSQVLSHMPSADTYISQAFPEEVLRSANKNKDAGLVNDSMLLVGHGDGGGGASPAMVESLRRMRDVDGMPKVEFDTPTKFFGRAREVADSLPRWVGELYFELHRGTYTSQAKTKQANRYCEHLLRDAELAASLLASASDAGFQRYPREKLLKCWKLVLKNCFHDTLPGSCIGMVYDETARDYEFVVTTLLEIIDSSLAQLCAELKQTQGERRVIAKRQKTENGHATGQANGDGAGANGAASSDNRVAFVRGPVWDCGGAPYVTEVRDAAQLFGDDVLSQPCKAGRMVWDPRERDAMDDGKRELVALQRRPVGFGLVEAAPAFRKADAEFAAGAATCAAARWDEAEAVFVLRNDVTEVKVQKSGRIVSVSRLGSKAGRNGLSTPCTKGEGGKVEWGTGTGNRLVLYDDVPMFWDAWDTEAYAFEKFTEIPAATSAEIVEDGPLRAALLLKYPKTRGGSTITQTLSLCAGSARLDMFTEVDWHESRKLLRAEFGTTVRSDSAWYDTQFGVVRRPTTANHSWEVAKFEVVGQRFADLSEHGYGVALLSDSKYGFSVRDATMRVTLLRSAKSPDDKMDMGHQTMTFSLLAHAGGFPQREVLAQASELNEPPRVLGPDVRADELGLRGAALAFVQTGAAQDETEHGCVAVSAVKMAEDGSRRMVLRAFETMGGHAAVRLSVPEAGGLGKAALSAVRSDMLEREVDGAVGVASGGDDGDGALSVELNLKPFEIQTVMLGRGGGE